MKDNVIYNFICVNRFFIHDVNTSEASLTKLENSFILISLNRFQQIIGVHTLQAFSEQIKVQPFSLSPLS